jgi:plastocyanin
MSLMGRRVSLTAAVLAGAVLLVFAGLLPAASRTPSREIVLVAKGMTFYIDGHPDEPNPTVHLRAGEHVRVVLRNDDRGMKHDFAVPAMNLGMKTVEWNERGEITFDLPKTAGTYEYVCRPHSLMMRGTIQVE